MNNDKIKTRLKELRRKNGYTQENIANILGIKRPTYAKYENGQSVPPIELFIRLSTLYGVQIDYLSGKETQQKLVLRDSATEIKDKAVFFNCFEKLTEEQKRKALEYMLNLAMENEEEELPV